MSGRVLKLLCEAVPAGVAGWLVVTLVRVWVARFGYPFDLEWMEGGMLAHAWRLSHGLPLYVPPNPDFVPYVYPPGYSALLAALGTIFGLSPSLGRALSLLGAGAAAAAIAVLSRREGAPWVLVCLLPIVYLGTYPEVGAFFDIVRPDAVAVALFAWSVVLALDERRGAPVASGLLLAAAFLCKHNLAMFGVPLLMGLWWRDGLRSAVPFALASVVPALVAVGVLQWRSDGLFLTYLVSVPTAHERLWKMAYLYTPRELGTALPLVAGLGLWLVLRAGEEQRTFRPLVAVALPIVIGMFVGWRGTYVPPQPPADSLLVPSGLVFWALGAVAVAVPVRWLGGAWDRRRGRAAPRVSWREVLGLGVGVTALLGAGLMRAHGGGWINVHMPMMWVASVGVAILVIRAWRAHPALRIVASIALTAQFLSATARLKPGMLRPRPRDRERGDAFVEAARSVEGRVLSPFAAWIPVYAGKDPSLHWMGVWDLTHEGAPMRDEALGLDVYAEQHYWDLVLEGDELSIPGIRRYYRTEGDDLPTLHPRGGYDVGPTRKRVPGEPGPVTP